MIRPNDARRNQINRSTLMRDNGTENMCSIKGIGGIAVSFVLTKNENLEAIANGIIKIRIVEEVVSMLVIMGTIITLGIITATITIMMSDTTMERGVGIRFTIRADGEPVNHWNINMIDPLGSALMVEKIGIAEVDVKAVGRTGNKLEYLIFKKFDQAPSC